MNSKTKGITLIALVITIIVLLILAGVSIEILTGQNGILTQGSKAKTETTLMETQEKVQLEVAGSRDETGAINVGLLNDNLKNNVKGLTYNGATISDTNKITSLPAIIEVNGYKMQITENGAIKDITNAKNVADIVDYVTTDTLVIDDYGNLLIVPEDFKIRIDATTNNADTINEGIVVEDRKGNQFVWIPVGNIKIDNTGTTINIELKRYIFNDDGTVNEALTKVNPEDQLKTSGLESYYFTEALKDTTTSNAHGKDISTFVENSKNNQGYYIGRYEAGVANGKLDTSEMLGSYAAPNNSWTGYKTKEGKEIELVCKSGQQVWNYVTQNKASELARNMYTGKNYESDLINSYAWDTAIVFIQKCGTKTNSATYSMQNGKLTGTMTLTGTGKLSSTNCLDEQCNIHDMAGNEFEWTTETYSNSDCPCTIRGGVYYMTSNYTSYRYSFKENYAYGHVSFRSIIYW